MNARLPIRLALNLFLILSTVSWGLIGTPAHADKAEPKPTGKASLQRAAGPGQLEVVISTSDGGDVYGTLEIYQWQAEGEYFDYYTEEYFDEVATPATFADTLPAGDYYATFYDYSGVYSYSYLNGATWAATDLDSPGVISVAADQGTDATLTLTAAQRTSVSGLVTDTSGDPINDVAIYADLIAGDSYDDGWAFTGADGRYSLELLPGTYQLYVRDDDGDEDAGYEGTSTVIEVGDTPVTVPTIALAPVGRWSVSGTVTDSAGAPVPEVDAVLYRLYDENGDDVYDSYAFVDRRYSAANSYAFGGVRSSGVYTVAASAPGYATGVLGGGSDILAGTTFSPRADVTLDPIQLTRASTVSGTVSSSDGPATGVRVRLEMWDPSEEYFYSEYGTYTDAAGDYTMTIPSTGDYTLYFDISESDDAVESAWLVGDTAPAGPGAPGTFTVTNTRADFVFDKTLPVPRLATGTVLDPSGTGISGASVVAYVQYLEDDGDGTSTTYWDQYSQTLADDDGSYRVRVPSDSVVTFRFARGGYTSQFLGGGSSLPAIADSSNSRIVPSDGGVAVGPVTLSPFVSQLGTVGGQVLPYCLTNAVPANDDGSSETVDIPFDLTFFGDSYDQLWVNNNGNVTFNGPTSQYTPSDLTGATDQPIIAPFFADVDTTGAGSNLVTYGTSPDGNTLCINWADVGYYDSQDDKLNTFQLLLTRNDTTAGRVAGDFDITMNYDQVLWETGEASGGEDGFGGTSAAVGFSAGSGAPGTFVQLPGSFVNGALLDGGAHALISGSQNSSQPGRYVFQVRNDGVQPTLGSIAGSVLDSDESPVGEADVQICRTNGSGCSYTTSNSAGNYSFTALGAGNWAIRVYPPTDALFGGGATVTVIGGETTELDPIVLTAPQPLPSNVTLTNNGVASNGVPSVYYGDPLEFRVVGCAGVASPTYSVTLASGQVIRNHLPMTESPAGTYRATIAALVPNTGDAAISTNIPATCGGDLVAFNVYIDPSGIVTDQYGRPVSGATVTLSRSDTQNGTFTTVPNGSTIMSASNRANPSTTDATGYFRWDVQTGFYKVTAEAAGCTPSTTVALEVPPEKIDLVIKMTCTAAAPVASTAPSITGTPKVGQLLTAVDAVWPAPIAAAGVELRRNGVGLASATYRLTSADVGAVFTAVATGRRPDYVTEGGTGASVSFTPVSQSSVSVTGLAADSTGPTPPGPTPPGPTPPGPTPPTTQPLAAPAPAAPAGSGKVGTVLTAVDPVWNQSGVTTGNQWLRDGTPISDETGPTYAVRPADVGASIAVSFTGSKPGLKATQVVSSAITATLGDPATSLTAPSIARSPAVGHVITATPGVWSVDGLDFTYQWQRNGSDIGDADSPSYRVRAADVGQSLVVVVTASREGYVDGVDNSSAGEIDKVASRTKLKLVKKRVPATKRATALVTIRTPGIPAPQGMIKVLDGTTVVGRTRPAIADHGKVSIVLKRLSKGKHLLNAIYVGARSTAGSTSRQVTLIVVRR